MIKYNMFLMVYTAIYQCAIKDSFHKSHHNLNSQKDSRDVCNPATKSAAIFSHSTNWLLYKISFGM